jgi:Flp pilus assembly protein TadG
MLKNEEGQSVIEFMLVFPFLLGMVILLIQISTAIQISIVNQKYSRAQTLLLTFNHSQYPARRSFDGSSDGIAIRELVNIGYNRMVLGVSSRTVGGDEPDSTVPRAMTQWVTRTRSTSMGPGPEREEPTQRSLVRVRTTVGFCTPSWVVVSGSNVRPLVSEQDNFASDFSPSSYAYCRSPRNE